MDFSALMAVYEAESPHFLELALESIAGQSLLPTELVIVLDGPITERLETVIDDARNRLNIRLVPLIHHAGLGAALRAGVEDCRHEIIIRVDADDINLPNRFEIQTKYLKEHPEIAVLGGWTSEIDEEGNSLGLMRRLPINRACLYRFARSRSPLNHPTVAFRRSAVLAVGNYHDLKFGQDYDLWARLILASYQITNIDVSLVQMRSGKQLMQRRGGYSYMKNEFLLMLKLRKCGFLSTIEMARNLGMRFFFRIIPHQARGFLYRSLLRENLRGEV